VALDENDDPQVVEVWTTPMPRSTWRSRSPNGMECSAHARCQCAALASTRG